jgi:hypothetical protein
MNIHQSTSITCPNCGHRFPLDQAFQPERDALLEQERSRARTEIEREANARANRRIEEETKAGQIELDVTKSELTKSRKAEEDLMRENAQLRAANDKVKLEALREVNDKLDEERPKLREQATELANQEFRRREADQAEQNQNLRIQLAQSKTEKDALARTVEELQRQLERGTPAIIGAAQHVELEGQLRAAFRHDHFRSIKPGARGGDILQTFRSEVGQTFGWQRQPVVPSLIDGAVSERTYYPLATFCHLLRSRRR